MKKLAPLSLLAALLLSPFASAQIVVIQGTDTVASSRGTINGNFAYLNTNKITDPTTTIGDMIYRSSGGLTRLPIGTNGQCITVAGGIPAWANSCGGGGGGTINSVNGTSNQITAVTTSGNVVLALPSGGIILPGNLTAPTGSTITYTGSGLINANQLYGVTLSGLSTGLMKITSGVPSTAISGTDYQVPLGFSSPLSQSGGTVSCATCVVTGGANTYTGGTNLQDFSGVKLKPPVTIVASLPTAATNTNAIYEVTDGSTASDCTTGSGTNRVWCVSSGSGWVAMGGSAVTGSASPGATVTVTNSATPTFTCPSSTSGTTVLFKMASTLAATITRRLPVGHTRSQCLLDLARRVRSVRLQVPIPTCRFRGMEPRHICFPALPPRVLVFRQRPRLQEPLRPAISIHGQILPITIERRRIAAPTSIRWSRLAWISIPSPDRSLRATLPLRFHALRAEQTTRPGIRHSCFSELLLPVVLPEISQVIFSRTPPIIIYTSATRPRARRLLPARRLLLADGLS